MNEKETQIVGEYVVGTIEGLKEQRKALVEVLELMIPHLPPDIAHGVKECLNNIKPFMR